MIYIKKPKCKICSTPVKNFKSLLSGYSTYCSKICRNKDTAAIKVKVEQTCIERYGTANVSHTKIVKAKISKSNKGRQRSTEFKNKMSKIMKGNTIAVGRTLSEKHIKILSDNMKGKPAWNKGILHTEETKEKMRVARLTRVFPFKDSLPERILQEALRKFLEIETHFPIKGQPDIKIGNLLIFVDGDYWHGNPNKYKCKDILCGGIVVEDKWKRDKEITDYLLNKGYKVLRFWEDEIHNDIEYCVFEIKQALLPNSASVEFSTLI